MDYKLELTFSELLFIDDSVTLMKSPKIPITRSSIAEEDGEQGLRGLNAEATLVASEEFIRKIGGTLLEVKESKVDSTAPVILTEEELWLLRELADSTVTFGEEQVGLNLKVKVHEAFREGEVEGFDLKVNIEEGNALSAEELKRKLEEFNASTNKSTNKNPRNSPKGHPKT